MIDGFHAYETFHAVLMREFLRQSEVAQALPGALPVIEAGLQSPRTNPWLVNWDDQVTIGLLEFEANRRAN
jgi:hypothetical protein